MTDKKAKVLVCVGREALELEDRIDRLKTALENKDLKISGDHRKLLKEQLAEFIFAFFELMRRPSDIIAGRFSLRVI